MLQYQTQNFLRLVILSFAMIGINVVGGAILTRDSITVVSSTRPPTIELLQN